MSINLAGTITINNQNFLYDIPTSGVNVLRNNYISYLTGSYIGNSVGLIMSNKLGLYSTQIANSYNG
jgi:hypothetical protein